MLAPMFASSRLKENSMRFPTIHLNGTDFETLNREYLAAFFGVDAALDLLSNVTVHGRDYYVQEGNAASEAMEEHRERLRALEKIKADLVKIILDLDKQHRGG
jgi:hypothetical protein